MLKIIDGGGHCGCSRKMFQELYPDCEVYSFEPDPAFRVYCQDLMHIALWIEDGSTTFYKYRLSGASSLLAERKTTEQPTPIQVTTLNLSRWILENFAEDRLILKLDIEGAEYKILEHMLKTGAIDKVDKLYIEWHNKRVGIDPSRDTELMEQIKNRGVEIDATWNAMKPGYCIGNKL